jgi:hypothetical protein
MPSTLAAGRHLPRHQTEPGRHVARPTECLAVSDRGNQSCRAEHTDSGDRRQSARRRVAPRMVGQIVIQSIDPLIKRPPLGAHVFDQRHDTRRQLRRRFGKKRAKLTLENLAPLPEGMSAFKQDRAKLVQERLARGHQTGADPVQGLQVEPILALHLDKAHRRSRRRFGDPGRIVVIVLPRADIRADVFRRHQPNLMPVRGKQATDMMRPTARLHGNGASRKFACKIGKRCPPDASA